LEQLAPCFRLLNDLVRSTEGREASLARGWSADLNMFQGLARPSQQGIEYAAHCSQPIYERLTGRADLSQLILG
jgi:hypothetical protein